MEEQTENELKAGDRRASSEEVTSAIRAAILSGELSPGSRIRQEELAARFGSSRIPVREALRRLEAEGLVLIVRNSGAWVTKLDLAEVTESYKIRQRLEPLAICESVPNLSEADIATLGEYLDRMEAEPGQEAFLQLDRSFHLLTYSGSRMPMLLKMIERFWNTTQHYRHIFLRRVNARADWIVHYEHRLLLEAIQQRDAHEAERILDSHLRRSLRELTHQFEETRPVAPSRGSSGPSG